PARELHISSDASLNDTPPGMRIDYTNESQAGNGTTTWDIVPVVAEGGSGPNSLSIGSPDTQIPVMTFVDNGHVGIGTTTPLNWLDVIGSMALGTYAGVYKAPVGTSLIVSGNIGLGTYAPLNKLDVNGAVAIGTYAGTSSAP